MVPKHIINNQDSVAFLNHILSIDHDKAAILYNIGLRLVGENSNEHYQSFIKEYNYTNIDIPNIPYNEPDILGATYQFLNTKYENLNLGAFYTNTELAKTMVGNLSFDNHQTIIDPSCGSGVFLFSADVSEDCLFGVDYDPIAVMIAKFNFFIKFPSSHIYPQIYHADFIEWFHNNRLKKYDYVVGNPPYGAQLDVSLAVSDYIKTGESFSYFVEYGLSLLKQNGLLIYLLPESFLNVKRHMDIRDFVLEKTSIKKIKKHKHDFAGVMSDLYEVVLSNTSSQSLDFIIDDNTYIVQQSFFEELKNHIFTPMTSEDIKIIEKIKKLGKHNLMDSKFALGVVTGNNAEKLLDNPITNSEPIWTGKEIDKYMLMSPNKYLVFDRTQLQQVAPDEMYRASAKLVYQVINTKLKVAIDLEQRLTSSSANIIIPMVPNNTIYSVALLLNSNLFTFFNQKMYGKVNKISKENLQHLPLPEFSSTQLDEIYTMIQSYMTGAIKEDVLQLYIYNLFNITESEQKYILNAIT